MGIPSNSGWIRLDDSVVKLWVEKESPGWIQDYEKEMSEIAKKAVLNFTNKGMTEGERIKIRKDFYKWLTKEIRERERY